MNNKWDHPRFSRATQHVRYPTVGFNGLISRFQLTNGDTKLSLHILEILIEVRAVKLHVQATKLIPISTC